MRDWGMPHAGKLPGGPVIPAARNVYVAMSGFKAAKDLPAWCNANPAGWDIVTRVLNMKAQSQTTGGNRG